ncbi:MAG: hypothetical protein Q8L68_07180 [Methylococcales bacterium]|nr:hypothetical protein [Methylococcales bacterium]
MNSSAPYAVNSVGGDIDNEQLDETLSGFDAEWLQFNHQPLGDAVVTEADKLMRRKGQQHGLRALDALQFASFILLAEEDWAFVVADGLLADIIAAESFTVIRVALA